MMMRFTKYPVKRDEMFGYKMISPIDILYGIEKVMLFVTVSLIK